MSLLTGIVAYWKFDEGSGTTTADATGNGNTGTLSGSTIPAWTTSGKINDALTFNGSTAFVDFGSAAALAWPFTINLWFNPSSVPTTVQTLATIAHSSTTNYSRMFIYGPHSAHLSVQSQNIGISGIAESNSVSASSWQMATGVFSSSTSRTIYYNGGNAVSDTTSVTSFAVDECWAGKNDNNGVLEPFSGGIDEVGLWSRALTSTEISQLYNSGAGLQYPFSGGATESLFRQSSLTGIGSGGPFFQNPLTRSMLGWRKSLSGLLIPDRKMVPA